jgi:putative Mg2+ transporter-C (MgtC) family protein
MEFNVDIELALRLLISFAIGTAIGLEREYRSKAAGLRTMIMICLGSTIFTELSISMGGDTADRIASTIVTGVGFLGAGVIFKDGLSVTGITTATTIWISAALGMAVGAGEYFISLVGSVVVLIVLILFEKLQLFIERIHQTRAYKISLIKEQNFEAILKDEIHLMQLQYRRRKEFKEKDHFIVIYEIFGSEKKLDQLNEFLNKQSHVMSYEY